MLTDWDAALLTEGLADALSTLEASGADEGATTVDIPPVLTSGAVLAVELAEAAPTPPSLGSEEHDCSPIPPDVKAIPKRTGAKVLRRERYARDRDMIRLLSKLWGGARVRYSKRK